MTLHHFTHQSIDGSWHAVYRVPGINVLHSVGESACKRGAQAMADEANREQARRNPGTGIPPHERKLAAVYDDAEAV